MQTVSYFLGIEKVQLHAVHLSSDKLYLLVNFAGKLLKLRAPLHGQFHYWDFLSLLFLKQKCIFLDEFFS